MTSENLDVVTERLFSTMNKYHKSIELDKLNINDNQGSDEVKINVITPIYDQKDVEVLTVIAVVLGEYQIKKIDIDDELEKANGKKSSEDYMIKVPFVFKRSPKLGSIQYGDVFFKFASSEELGPQEKTECEKKKIHKRF